MYHFYRITLLGLVVTLTMAFQVFGQGALVLKLRNMNPHVGQKFQARVVEKGTGKEIDRQSVDAIASADFEVTFNGILAGHSYDVDFFADLNMNGLYDSPPTDHTWRLALDNAAADENELEFQHNTNFTDLSWTYELTLNFMNMTPHVGQLLGVRVVDQVTNDEVTRTYVNPIESANFSVSLPGLQMGGSYNVDFFADFNKNGSYDAPPTDHAWRLTADNVNGDTSLDFTHNTTFTDINWSYLLTLNFINMTPHVGQLLGIRVVDQATNDEVARTFVDPIESANFSVSLPGLQMGQSYNVDFFADFNKNGSYDAPPADHAWRLLAENVSGDTSLDFTHNTNFTEVGWPVETGVKENGEMSVSPTKFDLLPNFPNPFNPVTAIKIAIAKTGHVKLQIFNMLGQPVKTLIDSQVTAGYRVVLWDGRDDNGKQLVSGTYFYRI